MKNHQCLKCATAIVMSALIGLPVFAEDAKKDAHLAGQPSEAETMAMMTELAKPGENHKLLADGVGKWTYTMKWWMDPSAAPTESSGTSVAKEVMGGRYVISEHTGKVPMPGADGKLVESDFKGMSVEGYDNVKKKFVSSWIDNMGTGIMLSEGDYDAASKSLTYRTECEMMPGVKTKIREVIKITDKDHRTFEFYEDRGGTEVKTMEIKYARKG
jgi:hypothetical protein